ncbi:putative cysteine-rich receptor-like protein kinase 39 [Porphyridium purpureum]|uniref:Putative cysteine-rich receptor-like protein kinase 39 n=1 Tax=Porphyridium purpureum TaxID=35688 RepID=A0A5J4YPJ9_PORPP|nr:putative cysteine-rich receptor-like protein kinase 39 [Porphyridium purpureum]|eukprot:POR1036..scf296_7
MATANQTEWPDSLRLGGALANDVGELIPFVDTIFTVTRIIVEYVQAAEANHESCEKLAERATSISNTLRTYFRTEDEAYIESAYDAEDTSMVECISELESELQSACALVKRFSSPEKWTGKALRALMAKNFQGEFLTCEARLVELETRLARMIILRMSYEQKQNQREQKQSHREQMQNHQVVIGKLEAVVHMLEVAPHEMFRALEADRRRDMTELEIKLRSRPEKGAVLSMHGVEVKSTSSYLQVANSGRASNGPEGSEPWYVEAALAEKHQNVDGTRVRFIPLGDGGSGSVFKGKFNGQEVAIKEIRSTCNKALAVLRNEVGIMWRLSHENVVQTRGGFYPRTGVKAHELESPFIVLEFAPKGSLEKYMFHESGSSLLPRDQLLRIFRSIIDGLKYLHGNKIIHRDMKPQNVLLMDDWAPKISDFGLATVKKSCSFANTMLGTSGYMAPEVIRGDQYNRSCDVWSYGVMLFEMMLGETMFKSHHTVVQILKILEDPKQGVPWDRVNKSEYAKEWPAWVVKIARACLQTMPEKRPTVSDIWREFYDRMRSERASVTAKSQNPQLAASPFGSGAAKVGALAGNISQVTMVSHESDAPASMTGGSAAGPSGSRPVQVQAQAQAPSADEMLRYAEEWEKAGNMAYAYEYFKLAAEAGVAEGQFRLGKILLDGSHGASLHLEHGAGWVRAAAEKGHTDAIIEYGRCHHSGRGMPQNWSLAKEWYAKAAKLGSSVGSEWLLASEAEEQTALSRKQNEAEKRQLAQDKKKAECDRQAQEHAAAARQAPAEEHDRLEKDARDLAAQREVELAVSQRLEEDAAAAVAAAQQARRDAAAWQQRGRIAEDKKDFAEALMWYRKAAQLRDAYSQSRLGYFYHKGWGGLRQDSGTAVEWWRKASKQGDAAAQYNLGRCCENGWGGLRKNKRAAVEWWRKAAEQGYAGAQFSLGTCYRDGQGGLPQDTRAATEVSGFASQPMCGCGLSAITHERVSRTESCLRFSFTDVLQFRRTCTEARLRRALEAKIRVAGYAHSLLRTFAETRLYGRIASTRSQRVCRHRLFAVRLSNALTLAREHTRQEVKSSRIATVRVCLS